MAELLLSIIFVITGLISYLCGASLLKAIGFGLIASGIPGLFAVIALIFKLDSLTNKYKY